MKTKQLLLIALWISPVIGWAQTTLKADVKNSQITWTGHAEVGSYAPSGTLALKDGQVTIQKDELKSASLTIDMVSMYQQNKNLVEHLKSSDFFDVEKYPVSTLIITRVLNGKANGTLTIKGKALPIICQVIIKKETDKTTVSGSIIIDRTSYGIIYNSGSFFSGLGDKAIKNTFDVAFNIVFVK